jgi:ABC-2 type transport system permease protein
MTTENQERDNFLVAMLPAILVEFRKIMHSKTLWITALALSLVSLVTGLFMFIMQDPERAKRFGLIGAKAQIFGGSADWPSLINLTLLMLSVGGLIIFGFIFIWIFGREFSDKTVYDLLSLPTSRLTIVMAKLTVAGSWSLVLVLMASVLMMGIGAWLRLPGWSAENTVHGFKLLVGTGFLSILLSIPFSLAASMTRGYLPAVGCLFLALVSGQVIGQLGYGQYYPWTIPIFYSGAAEALIGQTAAPLGFGSYAVVFLVSMVSLVAAMAWWLYADQT